MILKTEFDIEILNSLIISTDGFWLGIWDLDLTSYNGKWR